MQKSWTFPQSIGRVLGQRRGESLPYLVGVAAIRVGSLSTGLGSQ